MIPHHQPPPSVRAAPKNAAMWIVNLAFAVFICLIPAGLWSDALLNPLLKLDDFVYLARSRTLSGLFEKLMTPHNAHVVPLFAVQNHLLARLAGTLEAVPGVWTAACYLELVFPMIVAGLLVTVETNRAALGLAAMASLGISTVVGPAVLWYSAGQALCCGALILTMLLALSLSRLGRSRLFLPLAALAAASAPLYWSAGYVAGPVALAYGFTARRVNRRIVLIPIAASLLTGILVWSLAGSRAAESGPIEDTFGNSIARIPSGLAHTAQAIPEVLILNNLGLNAVTTPPQALALCFILGAGWVLSRTTRDSSISQDRAWRRRIPRLNSLEAAGATLIVTCFVMIYSARGYLSFENLRALGWYHAIPQLGAVLVAAGWAAGAPLSDQRGLQPASYRELLGVVLFVGGFLVLQIPRANRVLYEYDGMASKIEAGEDAPAQAPRGRADLVRRSNQQRAELGRLDRLERVCRKHQVSREMLRTALGRPLVPGMPPGIINVDAFDLLDIPDRVPGGASAITGELLREFKAEESSQGSSVGPSR